MLVLLSVAAVCMAAPCPSVLAPSDTLLITPQVQALWAAKAQQAIEAAGGSTSGVFVTVRGSAAYHALLLSHLCIISYLFLSSSCSHAS